MSLWLKIGASCIAGYGVLTILFVVLSVVAGRSGGKSIKEADVIAQKFLAGVAAGKSDDAYWFALMSSKRPQRNPLLLPSKSSGAV